MNLSAVLVLLVLSLLTKSGVPLQSSLLRPSNYNRFFYCKGLGSSIIWRANNSTTLGKFNGLSNAGDVTFNTNSDGTRVVYASMLLQQKNRHENETQRSSMLFLSEEYLLQRNTIECIAGGLGGHAIRLEQLEHETMMCNTSGRYLKWRADNRTIAQFNGARRAGYSMKNTNANGTGLQHGSILLSRRQNSMNKTERTSLLILSNEFRRGSIQCIGESGNQPIYSVSTQTPSRPVSTQDIGDQRTTIRVETMALNSALCYVVPYRVAFLVAILIILL